jgi:alkanesulfonate monooxygenase SsuD/methylene tetrahydromethanopterin reductase-like flavin-dependent oxidoreductase (luciferase family)
MRVGVSPFGTSRHSVEGVAQQAVGGGIDTLWLGDGYLTNADFPGWAGGMESVVELSWLAGRLPSARVGLGAAVLTIRDPAWLAKQANTLARVAGGGFVLVVAAGFWARELEVRGVSFQGRGARFDAMIDTLSTALLDPALSPGVPDAGPVPLWLAGGDATMARAVRRGLPYQASRATPEELAPTAARFFDSGGTVLAHRVRMELGSHTVRGQQVDWHAVIGSADRLVDALGRYRELGVSDLSILPGQDDGTAAGTVEALVSEIIPQLT